MFDDGLWPEVPMAEDRAVPARMADPVRMGRGTCGYPRCYGGGGFRPCVGFTGTGEDCLNCGHAYSYHA